MTSLRMTGSGEPATTTLPSRFAPSTTAFHSLSLAFTCADTGAVPTRSRTKAISGCMAPPQLAIFMLSGQPQSESPADQHHHTDHRRDQQTECRAALEFTG